MNLLKKDSYCKIFSGQLIEIIKIKAELEKFNIIPIIKDKNESARLAGFGTIFNIIEVFVHNDELNKSLKILEKKSTKPKELFGRLMYLNQQIFNSSQKYDLVILANKLNEYKYFLLNEDDPSSYATLFFNTLQEFINIYCKILNVKSTVDAITPIFTHLSFDKDK